MTVTGIGQCSWDYIAVVDKFPRVDTKKEILEWEEQGGGPVATALVTLSRLGVKCRFYGVTGDDPEGEKIRRSLADKRITTKGLKNRDNASSQKAFIAVEQKSGKRTIFWKRPSGAELKANEVGDNFLKGSNFLLLDGLMKNVSLYAAKKAKSSGVPIMLDAGKLREGMLNIAQICDYVVASEEFGRELGWNGNPEEFLRKLKKYKLGTLTVTLGAKGSITFADGKYFRVPAFKVKAVDTTGAGDVFHGGYIYGLLQGWGLKKTVIFASAVAALKCGKIGGRAGIPTLVEISKFLGRHTKI